MEQGTHDEDNPVGTSQSSHQLSFNTQQANSGKVVSKKQPLGTHLLKSQNTMGRDQMQGSNNYAVKGSNFINHGTELGSMG